MKEQLRFNICDLWSSFIPDNEISDLTQRIKKCISPPLGYACRHWGDHLQLSAISDNLCSVLSEFLSRRLLFWMEVLNLKRCMIIGVGTLSKVQAWLAVSPLHVGH